MARSPEESREEARYEQYRVYAGYRARQKVRDRVRNRNWYLPLVVTAFVSTVVLVAPGPAGDAPLWIAAMVVATVLTYNWTWSVCSQGFPPDHLLRLGDTVEPAGAERFQERELFEHMNEQARRSGARDEVRDGGDDRDER